LANWVPECPIQRWIFKGLISIRYHLYHLISPMDLCAWYGGEMIEMSEVSHPSNCSKIWMLLCSRCSQRLCLDLDMAPLQVNGKFALPSF
jgi:hypothetical protein